jgi:dihydropteroate synthase
MSFSARPEFVWRLRSRSLELGGRTRVMAILNLTPDSFSGDGLHGVGVGTAAVTKMAVAEALQALDDGADILDLGAESTRPGATTLGADEEADRLLPVLEAVHAARPEAVLSVDTYHAATAWAAVRAGAEIVNDVSGLMWDGRMAEVVATTGCGLVMMHTRGRPAEWRSQPALGAEQVVSSVFAGLCERVATAEAAGIADERIVLDPGFGFGKRGVENFALLAGLGRLHELGRPLLIGLSRKGFLGEAVRDDGPGSDARRTATVAANTAAILAGAHVLRVHDVAAAVAAVAVADALLAER